MRISNWSSDVCSSDLVTVVLPEIHDGELRRIEIPGDGTLALTFETIDKELRSITLEGVEDFRCEGLLAGNMIFDLQRISWPGRCWRPAATTTYTAAMTAWRLRAEQAKIGDASGTESGCSSGRCSVV